MQESWSIENKGTSNEIYREYCQNWLENGSIEIILSTWLYNYIVYCAGIMYDYAGVIIKVSKSLQKSVYMRVSRVLTMFWGRLFHSLITEGEKEN